MFLLSGLGSRIILVRGSHVMVIVLGGLITPAPMQLWCLIRRTKSVILFCLEDIEALVAYLPILYSEGSLTGRCAVEPVKEWRGGEKTKSGAYTFPWPEYNEEVKKFFKLAMHEQWIFFFRDRFSPSGRQQIAWAFHLRPLRLPCKTWKGWCAAWDHGVCKKSDFPCRWNPEGSLKLSSIPTNAALAPQLVVAGARSWIGKVQSSKVKGKD